MGDTSFLSQTAIVTGGASGIGLATCQRLAELGANVVIADLDEPRATQAAARLVGEGRRAIPVGVDVTEPASVAAMLGKVMSQLGTPHVLIHSAGIGLERPFLDTSLEEWQRILTVDLTGTFVCGQLVAREMVRTRYAVLCTWPQLPEYAAALAGQHMGPPREASSRSRV